MIYLVGVDGGGTRTRAVVVDEAGRVIGQGESGPSNFHSVGVDQAVTHVKESIQQALSGLDINDNSLDAIVLGLAGVGRSEDHAQMWHGLHNLLGWHSEKMILTTDAQIALTGGVGGQDGIIVIAGTGAIALGTKDNQLQRAGGWGYLLDDRGSGYDLGRQGIIAALRGFDGRGPETLLQDLICTKLNFDQITNVVSPIHQGQLTRTQIADLAPIIVDAANAGDQVAQQILQEGGRELALAAIAVAQKLGLTGEFVISYTGGILTHKLPYLYPTFFEELIKIYPKAEIRETILQPVYGALIMAGQKMNLPVQPMIRRWKKDDHEA